MKLEELIDYEDTIAVVETKNPISPNGKFYKAKRNGISRRKEFARKVYAKSDGVLEVPVSLNDIKGNSISGEVYIYYRVVGDISKGMSIGSKIDGKFILRSKDIIKFIEPAVHEAINIYLRNNSIEDILYNKEEYLSLKKEINSEVSTLLLTKRLQPYQIVLMLNIGRRESKVIKKKKILREVYDVPQNNVSSIPDFEMNAITKENISKDIEYLSNETKSQKVQNNERKVKRQISLSLVENTMPSHYSKAPDSVKEKVEAILTQNEMYASNPTYWREVLTNVISTCLERAEEDGHKRPLLQYITESEFSNIKDEVYKEMFLGDAR
jgi:hypothetical protein